MQNTAMNTSCLLRCVLVSFAFLSQASVIAAQSPAPRSVPVASILLQPLPAENLAVRESDSTISIEGPTFAYTVDRATGMISELAVRRDGAQVLRMPTPATLKLDGYQLAVDGVIAKTTVASANAGKVVLNTVGELKGDPALPFTLETTFFSDGVVVARVTITPPADLAIAKGMEYAAEFSGKLDCYLHKCHERWDADTGGGLPPLPAVGNRDEMATTTSCLQVMSHDAAAAIFTDLGAYHVSPTGQPNASIERKPDSTPGEAHVALTQRIVHVGDGGEKLTLAAGKPFSFRFGMCVAPQRLPHPRHSELRHFTWIGDDAYPYPTDEEIEQVAQLGFNVFQTHRLGLLGQPRPPRGELERVIAKVHEEGMLFILLTLPDLLDAHSPRLQLMKANGTWPLWEANNYGGHYTATMDKYCDYYGTCVGAPNGLADYHIETAAQMLDRFDVDGIYLDDNITQGPSCPHWQLHGHPRPGYDCLIELHEVNWRRRRFLLERVPHMLLVDHCNIGLWLPLLAPFDAHLYGEGHNISTLDGYWNFYGKIRSMHAQGNLWPGGVDGARFATPGAYTLDLLTGGGQYMYIDWRLFTKKFPHAAGVLPEETAFVRAFNLAQHYFGMHESTAQIFSESAEIISGANPATAVTTYQNRTWGDQLIVIGNASDAPLTDSISLHSPQELGIDPSQEYGLFDVVERTYQRSSGADLEGLFGSLKLPANGLRLLYLHPIAKDRPQHIWGGKRIEEIWDPAENRLSLRLSAPAGVTDSVFLTPGPEPIAAITVNGKPAKFARGTDGQLLHGEVSFGHEPVLLEMELGPEVQSLPAEDPARQALYPE
jgi:hypothetical protein